MRLVAFDVTPFRVHYRFRSRFVEGQMRQSNIVGTTVATMMLDNATALTQIIGRAMMELVDLNNQGVSLLGEGRLELASSAIYNASDRIQLVREAQAHLKSYMARRYDHHHPRNLVLGVQGHCFVTPLEPVTNNEGVTMMMDPMSSHTYGPVPVPHPTTQTTTAFVASTASNEDTSHDGRTSVSSLNETVVDPQHASLNEVVVVEPLSSSSSSSSTKTSSSSTSSSDNVLVEEERRRTRSPTKSTPNKQPPRINFFSFLRPIFFSAQDFLHLSNPPLNHLTICLLFNLAVVNHKLAMRMQSSSSQSLDGVTRMDDHDDNRQRQRNLLEEAIYLYKLAYRLQMEDGLVEVSRLHTLGIVNNLGQLYYHAEMYAASIDCFQTLLEMIMVHRVRDQGCLLRLNRAASLFGEERSSHYHSASSSLQQQLLLQREQQVQQDAPYMELFLDNVFQVLGNSQACMNAPAA